MEGVIANFRMARHHQKGNHIVITIKGYDKEKAKGLIGKKVEWTTPSGKVIKGKISAVHGNKGAVRALFEKGLPGQSIGQEVKIEPPKPKVYAAPTPPPFPRPAYSPRYETGYKNKEEEERADIYKAHDAEMAIFLEALGKRQKAATRDLRRKKKKKTAETRGAKQRQPTSGFGLSRYQPRSNKSGAYSGPGYSASANPKKSRNRTGSDSSWRGVPQPKKMKLKPIKARRWSQRLRFLVIGKKWPYAEEIWGTGMSQKYVTKWAFELAARSVRRARK